MNGDSHIPTGTRYTLTDTQSDNHSYSNGDGDGNMQVNQVKKLLLVEVRMVQRNRMPVC